MPCARARTSQRQNYYCFSLSIDRTLNLSLSLSVSLSLIRNHHHHLLPIFLLRSQINFARDTAKSNHVVSCIFCSVRLMSKSKIQKEKRTHSAEIAMMQHRFFCFFFFVFFFISIYFLLMLLSSEHSTGSGSGTDECRKIY